MLTLYENKADYIKKPNKGNKKLYKNIKMQKKKNPYIENFSNKFPSMALRFLINLQSRSITLLLVSESTIFWGEGGKIPVFFQPPPPTIHLICCKANKRWLMFL